MGYFDLMYFVLAYKAKHGTVATVEVVYIITGSRRIGNLPEDTYLRLAEELVRRY